jgi:pSer/pThr/pTyr-binding forkhead associated (FHA) protein
MDATLKVLSGLLSGQSVRLNRKLVIGRADDCDFKVDSEFVSAHHCALLLDEFTLRLLDLGSKNGTFVNGQKIGTRMIILLHGDTISIGNVSLRIDLTPGTDGAEFLPPQAVPRSDLPNILSPASDPDRPPQRQEDDNG